MKALFSVLAVLALVGFTAPVFADDDVVFEFPATLGKISFHHTKHQARTECATCHPTFPEKFDPKVSIKDQAHVTCKNCHTSHNASTACTFCHKK